MSRFLSIALVSFAALATAAPAVARPITNGISGEEMVKILQEAGYRATLSKDDEVDPLIKSAVAGKDFNVVMYGCENGRCKSFQFLAGFDLDKGSTAEVMNDWNRNRRFASAYLDDENDPFLQMDLDVEKGSSTEQVAMYLETWETVVGLFSSKIGFK